MKTLTGTVALFILTGFFLALSVNLCADVACARADFATFADRNTRPTEPVGYDVNGTSVQMVVAWNGTRGVGNLGIGNGDVSLMKPEVINSAIRNARVGQNVSANVTARNETLPARNETLPADNDTKEEDKNATGWGFRASDTEADADGDGESGESGEAEEAEDQWESLLPEHVAAASVITRGEPYSITINEPYPHILNENPTEPAVLYAKMLGLPLPGGRMIDMGIKSLGTEF